MGKIGLVFCLVVSLFLPALATEPVVAIHVSELTQALETRVATPPTPTGSGTTGYEWWTPWWHYFVMPESVKEALRSDGTRFVVVSDADISAGNLLLPDGTPRYPIVISLASEAIRDDEISPLRDYVAAGGFLLVGSSAFTRHPDGTSRGDFALAGEMGLHTTSAGLDNWQVDNNFSKQIDHRLVSHIPSGDLSWEMPQTSEDISWGTSPAHSRNSFHRTWRVSAGGATVIASSSRDPYLVAKSYGRGYFIYHAAMQPLIGNGGRAPGMYAYGIFRNAIEWAFESANLPVIKVSPWPYAYNAAYLVRHDFEAYPWSIDHVESSAEIENSLGAKGDYYFCTGTLREEMGNSPATVASLRRAVSLYGATIGSHNGGLKNPNNASLSIGDDDYWHWGPDEALDSLPPGYASGRDYAYASLAISFADIDGWLAGLDTNKRTWTSPYFNATRDASNELLDQLGAITSGEQKLSPFPHWVISTRTQGKRFRFISLPPSDWYINSKVAHAIDSGDGHNSSTIDALVDYYYGLGALVNLYSHDLSTSALPYEYLRYCAAKPAIWPANAAGVFGWWTKRSPVQITPSTTIVGNRLIATVAVTGATDPDTAIELVIPNWVLASSDLRVMLDGVVADPGSYRIYRQGIKVKVGTTVSVVEVSYPPVGLGALDDAYSLAQGATLNIVAPGVLGNDTGGGTSGLTAILVSQPAHGTLNLHSDGSFFYTPVGGFSGADSFTYQATDGSLSSNTALVSLTVTPPTTLSSISLNPTSVLGGNTSTGTVTLSDPAPTNGAVVTLSSSNTAAAQVPASVTVAASATTATFTVTTSPVASNTSVTISGTYNSTTRNAGLTMTVLVVTLSSVSLNPTSVLGGNTSTGTVTLSAPAPTGGAIVALSSSNTAAAQVPASVTVAANGTTATFTVTTSPVASNTNVTISGTYNSAVRNASLTVTAAVLPLISISLNPTSVVGGNSSTGTVTLSAPAPAGGAVVTLLSSNTAAAQVPPNVTVAANASTATFMVTSSVIANTTQVTITASYSGASQGATLIVMPGGSQVLFSDDFSGPPGVDPLWVTVLGSWNVASGVMIGSSPLSSYGFANANGNWTDYSVQARIQLPAAAFGGGLGGRVNPATGAHYGVWVYPEATVGGFGVVKVVKFRTWTSYSGTPMAQANLPGVGTAWHTLKVAFQGSRIQVFYDGSQYIDVTDNGFDSRPAYSSGGISLDLYTRTSPYLLSIDDVLAVAVSSATLASVSLSPTSVLGGNPSTGTVTLSGPAPAGGAVVTLSSNNPAAQVPASVTVATGSTTATFTVTTSPVAADMSVTISGTYNSTTQNTSLTVTAPVAVLSTVSLNPVSVVGGNSSTGTVTLSGPAPAGGAVVTLSSYNPAAQVPASVTVAESATTATFTVTTSPVAADTSVTISGTYNSTTQNTSLTLTAPVAVLSTVSLNPASVLSGNASTGTVTLSGPAPAGGAVVTLSSNNPAAQVPASVKVAAGSTTATFTVTTSPVAGDKSVTISALYNGVTQTASLTVTSPAAVLSTVSLNPVSVLGGNPSTGTVTLSAPAPTGGAAVTLSSGNAAAHVPASVTVAESATTATFTVTTSPVAADNPVTISALYNGVTRTTTLTVTAATLTSVSLSPASVLGGSLSTGTVTLSGRAPAGGAVMTLSNSNPAAQVPASVTVAASATTATFTVTTSPVAADNPVTISALYNGVARTATLTVTAATLISISRSPTSVLGGNPSTGTVTLSGRAPVGGAVVTLSSNNAAAQVPASVTVAANAITAIFTVTTSPVAANVSVTISALYHGVTRNATLTVTAAALTSVSLNPASVLGGNPSTGMVTLSGPAPAGGAVVTLSSNNAAAQVPASVTVVANATTAIFTVTTSPVAGNISARISAVYRSTTKRATLTVSPPSPSP